MLACLSEGWEVLVIWHECQRHEGQIQEAWRALTSSRGTKSKDPKTSNLIFLLFPGKRVRGACVNIVMLLQCWWCHPRDLNSINITSRASWLKKLSLFLVTAGWRGVCAIIAMANKAAAAPTISALSHPRNGLGETSPSLLRNGDPVNQSFPIIIIFRQSNKTAFKSRFLILSKLGL